MSEILFLIEKDICRFSEIKENLEGISDNVLSKNLNILSAAGILDKKIFNQVPLKVEYSLTQSGEQLVELLHELCSWGKLNGLKNKLNFK
ncbi:transcriptional regulator [Euzebyella marina]|uniref:Transcriptional regulator n=1 Tax=Euzebyella marina TaxID=1761453 RepID=A0A3G2L2A7_9FLAO|nr:helix-turn-helix domain-containing protein [Euzebyella marina]AYN66373.1 transcriptional regulator [Euzebyella marina]